MKVMSKGNKGNSRLVHRLLTVTGVTELLNVHPNTVRHWSNIGIIKAYRVGSRRDRRFKPEEINKFINNGQ